MDILIVNICEVQWGLETRKLCALHNNRWLYGTHGTVFRWCTIFASLDQPCLGFSLRSIDHQEHFDRGSVARWPWREPVNTAIWQLHLIYCAAFFYLCLPFVLLSFVVFFRSLLPLFLSHALSYIVHFLPFSIFCSTFRCNVPYFASCFVCPVTGKPLRWMRTTPRRLSVVCELDN